MSRNVCWCAGQSRVYDVEAGQESGISIGYPAALSAAGELRPVGVDAGDLVPGIVAQLWPAATPDGKGLAQVDIGTLLLPVDNSVTPAMLLRNVGVTADGTVTALVDGVNQLGKLIRLADGGAWVEVA